MIGDGDGDETGVGWTIRVGDGVGTTRPAVAEPQAVSSTASRRTLLMKRLYANALHGQNDQESRSPA
jgi:hypothetical protein